jgi:hypothetical protein
VWLALGARSGASCGHALARLRLPCGTGSGSSSFFSESNGGTPPTRSHLTGTVEDAHGLDGCTWLVHADDGHTYEPVNELPASVQRDGARLSADVTVTTGSASICMAGVMAEFTNVQALP